MSWPSPALPPRLDAVPHLALLTDAAPAGDLDGRICGRDTSGPSGHHADMAELAAFLAGVRGTTATLAPLDAAALRRAAGVADAVALLSERAPSAELEEALLDLVAAGTPVLLLGPSLEAWRGASGVLELAGIRPGPRTPSHEVRLRPGPGPQAQELTARMGPELVVTDAWPVPDKVADDVVVLLTAHWHLRDLPVVALRRAPHPVGTCSLGTLPGVLGRREVARLVHRLVRLLLGEADPAPVRVGLLGFGAVGAEHVAGVAATPGLELTAVCDRNPARLAAAATLAPAAAALDDAAALLERPDVDLVVVSTPPNAHAAWARRALESGRHVLVEKPFSLTVAEADGVLAAAAERGLVAASYQNRRFDPDYLAVKRAVHGGALGEVFSYDSFVGGYAHPCNYWHSDAEVSGGAHYDWGSHYLDWMLDLFPARVRSVSMTQVKRVWLDVTNADHARMAVRFEDGLEAEFVHSDLAAALKPKWHILGTAGALTGDWRSERVLGRNAVGTLAEERLAPADSPAELTLHVPDASGGIVRSVLPLVAPPQAPLHRDLADALLCGVPPQVRAEQSRRVVAVLEAATRSAAAGGAPVTPEAR